MTAGDTPTQTPRPKKFVFFPLGWLLAHVGRLIEIAKVLRARGHEVVFAGADPNHPRSKLDMAQAEGFRVVVVREPDHPYAWDRFVKHGWLVTAWDLIVRHQKWAPLDKIIEDQLRVVREEQPDMIVGDGTVSVSTTGYITGTPAAGVLNAYASKFVAPTSVFMPIIHVWDALALAPLRRRVYRQEDCKPVNALRLVRSVPLISPDLPGLYRVPKKFPHWHTVGPIISEPPCPAPDWLDEIQDGQPNVYITMGSTGILDTFLRRTFDALATAPYRFLLTTGGQATEETLAMAPANFRIAKYAPGSVLLKHCQALVFHGGNGTMYQGLLAGVPMIALPSHLEQGICADLGVKYGFGKRFSPRRVRGPQLVRALHTLIEEPAYREAARDMGDKIRATDGPAAAADIIEQAAAHGPTYCA